MVLYFALAVLLAREPDLVIPVTEPRATSFYSSRLLAKCGTNAIELRNIGIARPRALRPEILIDGRSINVPRTLTDFLGRYRALYRFSVKCPVGGDKFEITAYRQSLVRRGELAFDAITFRVPPGNHVEASEVEQTDADGIWF